MSAAYRSKMFPERLDMTKTYVWTREKQANGTRVRPGETVDLTAYARNKLESFLDNRWIETAEEYHGHEHAHALKHGQSKEELEAAARTAQEADAIEEQRQQDEAKAEADRQAAEDAAKEAASKTQKPYVKKVGRQRYVVMLGDEKMTGEMSEADATAELEKLV